MSHDQKIVRAGMAYSRCARRCGVGVGDRFVNALGPRSVLHYHRSDAGASAYLDVAIDQAWRAVGELTA